LNAPAIQPGLPSGLLRRRPDIAQAERAIAAADASLAAARDQMLPSLRLTASAGGYAHDLPDLLGSGTTLWSIGASVLAPIFDAGRLRAQAEISASLRDRSVFAYETVVRNAFAETENALAGIQRLREQLEQAEGRRVATAEALRIAHNRYTQRLFLVSGRAGRPAQLLQRRDQRAAAARLPGCRCTSICTGRWEAAGIPKIMIFKESK
jgi:multidrug efflux system outer membrane protein